MATAVKREKKVTTVSYELELTESEARVLYAVLGLISGDQDNSARRHLTPIRKALNATGIQVYSSDFGLENGICARKIYFD